MQRRLIFHLFIAALALIATTQTAMSQSLFERLVLPGDLIEGHADLQKECDNCHTSFRKGAQESLCLDCHEKVATDISTNVGFHGLSPEIGPQSCSHCHTDHIGRDGEIILMDPELLDHRLTDFPLDGAHSNVDCGGCHTEGKKFRDAPTACVDCHRDDDPHREQLGTECADCHVTAGWMDVRRFDHEQTDFPLNGGHQNVACDACHAGEIYEDLPLTCQGCHAIQDVHRGTMGAKCDTCHTSTKWTEVRFDHQQDTPFPLLGAHKEAKCDACHRTDAFVDTMGTACVNCHREDDAHDGKLGTRCESCHQSEGWLLDVKFDHDITRFPLIGQHTLTACEECHVDTAFSGVKTDCVECHQIDDIHEGRLGPKCETCHNPNGWAFWIFDHDTQTDFRLTGSHAGLQCEACHTDARKASLAAPKSCNACHAKDDIHKGQFGTRCEACHGTDTFENARLR